MSNPVVSVLMPAFNVEKYIAQAICSILQQSFLDFELIILNDGSTDGTSRIIDQFQDHRIQRIDLAENRGLVNARNQLVTAARGRYIAFLDADDVAMPHRLSTQVAFLDRDTVDICGSAYYSLYEASGKMKASKQRYSDADIRALISVSSPLCNPAVMGKALVFKKFPYSLGKDYAEDYSLWAELASAGYRFANLREKLITYRIHFISEKLNPRPMGFFDRVNIAVPFLMQLNQKISGVSIAANYEIYARFQYRGNGILTPFTRLERLILSVLASLKGRL